MSSTAFTQAVVELATLPEEAQTEVLAYIETLKQRYPQRPETETALPDQRYPLRGESYSYLEPFAPAVPAAAWDAIGEA